MSQRLDFLLIGAQKCATSWLYYCLKDHPELHLPAKKREVEYLGGDLYEARGADWYFSLMAGARDDQKVGDVSVEYLFDPRSPEIVHRFAPRVKLIVSLRDPIERALSAYYWNLRKGSIPDRPPEEGLQAAVAESSLADSAPVRTKYEDIIHRGYYDTQLDRYLRHFSLDQFLFVLHEDIERDALGVVQRIYRFLGVESSFRPASLNMRPKHNTHIQSMVRLERLIPRSAVIGKLMDITNQVLYRIGVESKKPSLPAQLMETLCGVYQPHVERTRQIILQAREEQRPFTSDVLKAWNKKWSR